MKKSHSESSFTHSKLRFLAKFFHRPWLVIWGLEKTLMMCKSACSFHVAIILLTTFLLTSCFHTSSYAPVADVSAIIEPIPKNNMHRVRRGETFYAIAWRYGLDYRRLAQRNGIAKPYAIHTGQLIYLRDSLPGLKRYVRTPVSGVAHYPQSFPQRLPLEKEPTAVVSFWHWPARGAVIGYFSNLNRGINIAGYRREPIYAAASGKIVYSGNGLRSYGNLIIIKHNSVFLTAYAHCNKSLVKEGEWVKIGQKIAEMGSSGSRRVMLHFEIRRGGEPQNPLIYLTNR
jgi:lipoprotein NlpD